MLAISGSSSSSTKGGRRSESRLQDCVYDLVYTVSSTKDFERDLCRMNNEVMPKKLLSKRQNRHARNNNSPNNHTGSGDNLQLMLMKGPIRGVRLSGGDCSLQPDAGSHSNNHRSRGVMNGTSCGVSTADILGRYRFKFFASPVLSKHSSYSLHAAPTLSSELVESGQSCTFYSVIIPPTPNAQSRGTQTDYRDNATQTEPYSPPFFVKPGSDAEVLLLSNLTWGHGLPAGRLEVDLILEARRRKKAELAAAGRNDVPAVKENGRAAVADLRRWGETGLDMRPLDAAAVDNWRYQNKIQETFRSKKLELLAKSLQDLRDQHGYLIEERLRRLWKRRTRENELKESKLKSQQNRGQTSADPTQLSIKAGYPQDRFGKEFRARRHQGTRKHQFERDLEDAYIDILEKKQLAVSGLGKRQQLSANGDHILGNDSTTQTDAVQPSDTVRCSTENHDSSEENGELEGALEKLLADHWDFINGYFNMLLTTGE